MNCWVERQKNIPRIVTIASNVIIMNCVLKFRNDLTDQKFDGYIQKPKGDFISCVTQPALVLKPSCCGQVKWDVKQYHVFWEMWGNATNCSSITGSCQQAYSSQKSTDGLLDYQDDTNTLSQMNLWSFKIHLNLESAKFEFDSVLLI